VVETEHAVNVEQTLCYSMLLTKPLYPHRSEVRVLKGSMLSKLRAYVSSLGALKGCSQRGAPKGVLQPDPTQGLRKEK